METFSSVIRQALHDRPSEEPLLWAVEQRLNALAARGKSGSNVKAPVSRIRLAEKLHIMRPIIHDVHRMQTRAIAKRWSRVGSHNQCNCPHLIHGVGGGLLMSRATPFAETQTLWSPTCETPPFPPSWDNRLPSASLHHSRNTFLAWLPLHLQGCPPLVSVCAVALRAAAAVLTYLAS